MKRGDKRVTAISLLSSSPESNTMVSRLDDIEDSSESEDGE